MIRPMRLGETRLRASALLGVGALAVHELRYLVGYGGDARSALAAHGHSYLVLATTLVVLVVLVALGVFLAGIARGAAESRGPASSARRLAAAAAGALLAIYSFQELVEGLVTPGHPAGLAGIYGNGGWSAVLFAGVVGLLIALMLRGAEAVLACVAAARRRAAPRSSTFSASAPRALRVAIAARAGLARHQAGRAPPLAPR